MKPHDAIGMLIQLAQKASDVQIRALGNALRRESSDLERLRLLSNYRSEYLIKYNNLCKDGVSTIGMRNFRQFLEKLEVAIAQQQSALNHSQSSADSARTALGESERSRQSLVLLRNRREATARSFEARREQKQHDEFLTQKGRRLPILFGPID